MISEFNSDEIIDTEKEQEFNELEIRGVRNNIVPSNDALQAYITLRERGSKILEDMNFRAENFDRKIFQLVSKLRKEFEQSIQPLQQEFDTVHEQIIDSQTNGLEKLWKVENDIIADKSLPKEKKVLTIRRLRKLFIKTFYPDDSYRKYVRKYSLWKLKLALSSVMDTETGDALSSGANAITFISVGGNGPFPLMSNMINPNGFPNQCPFLPLNENQFGQINNGNNTNNVNRPKIAGRQCKPKFADVTIDKPMSSPKIIEEITD